MQPGSIQLTPFSLIRGGLQVYLRIPHTLIGDAEFFSQQINNNNNNNGNNNNTTELEAIHFFLSSVLNYNNNNNNNNNRNNNYYIEEEKRITLLHYIIKHYEEKITENNDIHVVSQGSAYQSDIIRTYLLAREILIKNGVAVRTEEGLIPAIVRESRNSTVGIFAQFGGQGVQYFEELTHLYNTYTFTHSFIGECAKVLEEFVNNDEARKVGFYKYGMAIMKWIVQLNNNNTTTANGNNLPPSDYLASAPISYPLIFITQLCHYFVVAKLMFKTGDAITQLQQIIKGATGHSQGVSSAIVASMSRNTEDFFNITRDMLRVMLWLGLRTQQSYLSTCGITSSPLPLYLIEQAQISGDGIPSPLMAVGNIIPDFLEKYVKSVNSNLPENRRVELALFNGPVNTVLAGHPESLYAVRTALSQIQAKPGEDQSRVPFPKRKLNLWTAFLSVSVPFHSQCILSNTPAIILKDLANSGVSLKSYSLSFPVYSTFDGKDLRKTPHTNESSLLLSELITMQCCQPVFWHKALNYASTPNNVTHVSHIIIDFGPSGVSGKMTTKLKEGTGVMVIVASTLKSSEKPTMLNLSHLTDVRSSAIVYAVDWEKEFRPKLLRTADGRVTVDTALTRLTGKPPIIVAGMTPTTANSQIVSAFTNAGYHGELAGGGLPREEIMRETVAEVINNIAPGEGVHLNLLFLNSKMWGFQYPLVCSMRQEGVPIESVTIAAGVPSVEKSCEILSELQKNGIHFVSFKPESVNTILLVVEIAKNNPTMSVVLQWTGGRGGGHHSSEDFHLPILETYSAIRQQKNIILVAGSGIGDAAESVKYLRGTWANRFNCPSMPFDGVLVASRIMVAKEALTADEAKELIVATPGVSKESDWVKTFDGEIGGVITVISELGEPIHKVATRGIKLWADFEKKFFSLPVAQREKAILESKDYIIAGLNADFQKVYFGKKADGRVADVQDMTYLEVLLRMVELMHVPKLGWIHPSFSTRTYQFLLRTEQRLRFLPNSPSITSKILLERNPQEALEAFSRSFPNASTKSVASEDVDYFVQLCKDGGKPVNFIPVIDKELGWWFKKDSLWYSECIDAVPGRDIGRVAILQGPVAVRHRYEFTLWKRWYKREIFRPRNWPGKDIPTPDPAAKAKPICRYFHLGTIANEPIADILGGIHSGIIEDLKKDYKDNDSIPFVEYLSCVPLKRVNELPPSCVITELPANKNGHVIITIRLPSSSAELPDENVWREFLAGAKYSWWRALLTSPHVVRSKQKVVNVLSTLFKPRPSFVVEICKAVENDDFISVRLYDVISAATHPCLEVDRDGAHIRVTVHHMRTPGQYVPLVLTYEYKPTQGHSPIHEVPRSNQLIKDFYAKLWFEKATEGISRLDIRDTFSTEKVAKRADIEKYCSSIGAHPITFKNAEGVEVMEAPIDFHIFPTYNMQLLRDGKIVEGDKVRTELSIIEIVNGKTPIGKRLLVQGIISVNGAPLIEVTSQFLLRGLFQDFGNTFRNTHVRRDLLVKDGKTKAILQSKPWLKLNAGEELSVGDVLYFKLDCTDSYLDDKTLSESKIGGKIYRKLGDTQLTRLVATIDFSYQSNLTGATDPIRSYLERNGTPTHPVYFFEEGGYNLVDQANNKYAQGSSPAENQTYSVASGDHNPIHTNPFIAAIVGLPATITHGMWTAIHARRILETYHPAGTITSYKAQFVDMVKPQDQLTTGLRHVGMKNGKKIIEVKVDAASGDSSDSRTVVRATAEAEQPTTGYVFTGQGSAEPNMGMDLYKLSPVAKQLWDRADRHLSDKFGFSILEIVRKNPKQITIHFGGQKGATHKSNYMSLQSEVTFDTPNGPEVRIVPLFPGISASSASYNFVHPQGLLYATQFTQPALTMLEKAAFEDMRAHGLICSNAAFAGHSLGEFAALASIGNVLTVESLVELVFIRGITMQSAVTRDKSGKSQFAMVAVNPPRVGSFFTQEQLQQVVAEISSQSGKLAQVVNYNIDNWQYIVTGHISNMKTLDSVLEELKSKPQGMTDLAGVISRHLVKYNHSEDVQLQRGIATTPLPGIDVPFHSKYLLGGVTRFREYLRNSFNPAQCDMDNLIGRYVPNLTAKPFSIAREYVQEVYSLSQSPVMKELLVEGNPIWEPTQQNRSTLGYKILVELLAYQFASPVRWIETQEYLFKTAKVIRLIEVGPVSTLADMAKRTLTSGKFSLLPKYELLSFAKDKDLIYYNKTDAANDTAAPVAPAAKVVTSASPVVAVPVVAATAPVAATASQVADTPITALESLQIILANKLNRPLDEITPDKSIKDLVGGKSALQNEILGDLQKEFGAEPENAAESNLSTLAQQMGASYSKLGPHSIKLVARVISSKMPGGFGLPQIKSSLAQEYGLGEGRSEGVLLHTLLFPIGDRLANEADAKAWIGKVATESYAKAKGITLGRAQSGSSGGTQSVVDSAELLALQKRQDLLVHRSLSVFAEHLNENQDAIMAALSSETKLRAQFEKDLDIISAEHGKAYMEGIAPLFSVLKERRFNSFWNWGRQEAYSLYYDAMRDNPEIFGPHYCERVMSLINRATPDLLDVVKFVQEKAILEGNVRIAKHIQNLAEAVSSNINSPPTFLLLAGSPTMPVVTIRDDGRVLDDEVARPNVADFVEFVEEMCNGYSLELRKKEEPLLALKGVKQMRRKKAVALLKLQLKSKQSKPSGPSRVRPLGTPFLFLGTKKSDDPQDMDAKLTRCYLKILSEFAQKGMTFHNKVCLVTGCGKDSIGLELVKGLIGGGAKVIVTTSRFSKTVADMFGEIYQRWGGKDSEVILYPFNQGSQQDVNSLIDHIYDTEKGLGLDLDYIIPFAAVSEVGRDITNIDSLSELAHRVMLTNLLRMLGRIKTAKEKRGIDTKPTHVLLPLSPNHGHFGGDGLYGESKVGLEGLLTRWHSEGWNNYLTLTGAVIGWTRGTALMGNNNLVAPGIEKLGVRTFSQIEMAFTLLGLLHLPLVNAAQKRPIWADLSGGMKDIKDLKSVVDSIQ